ncbi:hypothetical protein [Bdellovibrio bacteriovorus]|uniref:Uncharacterized protein n=1 Tax=Bdellovibrio bacteriovorus TaxID=959 RepID=A0A1Z3N5G9_BDEBC|nr:hypothetical protein [Bdellovibrio bacteriovorus]ASD62715.1 hypothetical protein B9G79_03595 [Bdellovibrio bacteriovorus]
MKDLFRCLITAGSAFVLASCSSAPKASKNPQEEAALQSRAQKVITAGQTDSAKAGGYDAIPF